MKILVIGGGADLVNCLNLIKAMSGYSVNIAYPKRFFSGEGCPGVTSTSASTTMGMILAARNDKSLNCVSEVAVHKPKPVSRPVAVKPVVKPQRGFIITGDSLRAALADDIGRYFVNGGICIVIGREAHLVVFRSAAAVVQPYPQLIAAGSKKFV